MPLLPPAGAALVNTYPLFEGFYDAWPPMNPPVPGAELFIIAIMLEPPT